MLVSNKCFSLKILKVKLKTQDCLEVSIKLLNLILRTIHLQSKIRYTIWAKTISLSCNPSTTTIWMTLFLGTQILWSVTSWISIKSI
jgi:hypothetical protein